MRRATVRPLPRFRRRWLVVLAAAAAIAAALVVGRDRDAPTPADLATFPAEPLAPEIARAPGGDDAVRALVQAGAAQFDLGHYDEAARQFRAALAHDPARADIAYWTGLSTALAGDAGAAIPDLETAVNHAEGDLRARAAWGLANAYLRAGKPIEARGLLELIQSEGGPYGERAGALLQRLSRFDAREPRSPARTTP